MKRRTVCRETRSERYGRGKKLRACIPRGRKLNGYGRFALIGIPESDTP